MPAKFRDLTGQVFGQLTALTRMEKRGNHYYWFCRCACGLYHEAQMSNLVSGAVKSCGCLVRTNGGVACVANRYTYASYNAMLRRCLDENHWKFPRYGAVGVTVYFDWLPPGGFKNFVRDVGLRPKGMTLDRIKNELGYEPGNCRWANAHTQRMNQRRMQPWTAQNARENMP